MNDCEFIEDASGAAGGLAKATELCHGMNNGLTKCFDAFFGPDEVDSFDASCNTCRNFRRKPMTPEERAERNIFGMPGHCELKLILVLGWHRGQFCGFENADCYVNRRTGMKHKDACKPRETQPIANAQHT